MEIIAKFNELFNELYKNATPKEEKYLETFMLLGAIYELVLQIRVPEIKEELTNKLDEIIDNMERGGE